MARVTRWVWTFGVVVGWSLATAQPVHMPFCGTSCYERDDEITPGKDQCQAGVTATWCERWVPAGSGPCGDTWFNDPWAVCNQSSDVLSGPCSESSMMIDGKRYIRINSADNGTGTCCFYAQHSVTPTGNEFLLRRPTSPNLCHSQGGGGWE